MRRLSLLVCLLFLLTGCGLHRSEHAEAAEDDAVQTENGTVQTEDGADQTEDGAVQTDSASQGTEPGGALDAGPFTEIQFQFDGPADSTGADSAGTNRTGTDSAGTDSAGTGSTGTDSAGTGSTGTDSAGTGAGGNPETEGGGSPAAQLLAGRVICVDPGHCVTPLAGKGYTGPVSPLSDAVKPLYTEGTEGAHMTEEKLNLLVGLKLRDALEALGATVLMTREVSEITITGVERCEIANRGGADVNIHIHADGVDDTRAHGVSVLVPSGDLLGTPSIVGESVRLGRLMVDCVAEVTGAKNRGTTPRSDLTGFNFSEVPSVFIEMGFMTNPEEDALLESDAYQDKIVAGMVRSLILWYGLEEP